MQGLDLHGGTELRHEVRAQHPSQEKCAEPAQLRRCTQIPKQANANCHSQQRVCGEDKDPVKLETAHSEDDLIDDETTYKRGGQCRKLQPCVRNGAWRTVLGLTQNCDLFSMGTVRRFVVRPNVRVKRPPAVWRLGREADDKQHGIAAKAARRWRSV